MITNAAPMERIPKRAAAAYEVLDVKRGQESITQESCGDTNENE